MKTYYVLHTWGDVEPKLHGPYRSADHRDDMAHIIRAGDESQGSIYRFEIDTWLDSEVKGIAHKLAIDTYSGKFFDDEKPCTHDWHTPGGEQITYCWNCGVAK